MGQPPQTEIIFLGSGTSHGVPMIGCDCAVCRSEDPRDKRFRSSVALRLPAGPPTDGRVILIDAGPEFRLAAVANRLPRVDAVLLTHSHADHIMGMDDLRRYNNIMGRTIPCHGDEPTLEVLRNCFGYAVRPYENPDRPSFSLHRLDSPQTVAGTLVLPVPLVHGRRRIQGYRIGGLAYCTDCSEIPAEGRKLLEGLDVLVLGALRHTPHAAHFNLPQALAAIRDLAPRRAILTHIAHEFSHAATSRQLPANVSLAYDGLRVSS